MPERFEKSQHQHSTRWEKELVFYILVLVFYILNPRTMDMVWNNIYVFITTVDRLYKAGITFSH
jgi:hypothetical protein